MPTNLEEIQNLVEYIKQSGMRFGCREVIQDTQAILDRAGIISPLRPPEFEIIKKKLVELADETAAEEISYLLQNHPEPVLRALKANGLLVLTPQNPSAISPTTKRR